MALNDYLFWYVHERFSVFRCLRTMNKENKDIIIDMSKSFKNSLFYMYVNGSFTLTLEFSLG